MCEATGHRIDFAHERCLVTFAEAEELELRGGALSLSTVKKVGVRTRCRPWLPRGECEAVSGAISEPDRNGVYERKMARLGVSSRKNEQSGFGIWGRWAGFYRLKIGFPPNRLSRSLPSCRIEPKFRVR